MKKIIEFLIKWFIIFFIILTFILLYFSIFDKQVILDILNRIKQIIANLWYWNYIIILVFGFVESFPLIWVSVPWQTILLIIAWFLWYNKIIVSWTFAMVWALLGNYFWYLLWIKYWDSFFWKYWNLIWIWKTDVKYIKKWLDKHWWLLIVFGKFNNMFRELWRQDK